MSDDFLYEKRWLIGVTLLAVIVAGMSIIWWNKTKQNREAGNNVAIADLQKQNDELRAELSGQSAKVAGTSTSQNNSEKININTADATTLDKLPNIGPARAADIVSYREAHGGFKSIEELKNIKGIGDKYFEEMKDLITVGVSQ